MRNAAFLMKIRAGRQADYEAAHRPDALWPSILDACRDAGMRNYSIWLGGAQNRQAFGYFEADDVNEALRALATNPANEEWQRHMAPLLDMPATMREGEPTSSLRPVFYLP